MLRSERCEEGAAAAAQTSVPWCAFFASMRAAKLASFKGALHPSLDAAPVPRPCRRACFAAARVSRGASAAASRARTMANPESIAA